jgi:acetyl-CoA carboxylase biotin carboxyl carrier protein
MADSSSPPDFFDIERIQRLVEMMDQHSISEIHLRDGSARIHLRRGAETVAPLPASPPAYAAPAPPPAVSAARAAAEAPPAAPADAAHIALIKSPMVGTFYAAPDPDSPAYVKVGDPVGPESIVCIVEAMKVFNQIPAEVAGRIVAVLAENGEPIEFGQPLFKVDTRQ